MGSWPEWHAGEEDLEGVGVVGAGDTEAGVDEEGGDDLDGGV